MHTLASNMFYLPEIDESKAKRTILPVRTPSNPTRVPLAATLLGTLQIPGCVLVG